MHTSSDPAPAGPGHRVRVLLPADLHARPAGRLASTAGRFEGVTARVEHRGRTTGATSVLALMALGARAGDPVDLIVEGPGAEEAATALAQILAEAE
ncbi:HPr family phosphocarrier protein [Streptomyces glaucus]|uniref:HPr domain-containing protein n=1 Tax=Streptomyces glaucus TaxID=284029 RepID=A0ABN3J4R3_9ACTN